jgi:N-methylhydantoinase A/oxoprolinase/acetone carboxylase beta subunit
MRSGYEFSRSVSMRFRYQVHEIQVPAPLNLSAPGEVEGLLERFVERYEQSFGRGTALKGAGIEMLTFQLVTTFRSPKPELKKFSFAGEDPQKALSGVRPVYWEDVFLDTAVFDSGRLAPGNRISGPAVFEAPNTTILIHPGQRCTVNEYLDMVIEL